MSILNMIEDMFNEFMVNRLNKPLLLKDFKVFKVREVRHELIDATQDDDTVCYHAKIKVKTLITDILTKEDYIIFDSVLNAEECEKCNIPYTVRTLTIPLSFKMF